MPTAGSQIWLPCGACCLSSLGNRIGGVNLQYEYFLSELRSHGIIFVKLFSIEMDV